MTIPRPAPDEHHEYFSRYIDKVQAKNVLRELEEQVERVCDVIGAFGEEGSKHRYAEGKWSVKEILGHLGDTERVFGYRAAAFARGDTQSLPGMDEDAWVASASFDGVPLERLLDEFAAIRGASVALFRNLGPEELIRRGVGNGWPMSVRAVPWLIVGHTDHHLGVIQERYRLP
ncbi:DinB family protein [bacterium]|nr:DinB family protein [bacterium]